MCVLWAHFWQPLERNFTADRGTANSVLAVAVISRTRPPWTLLKYLQST